MEDLFFRENIFEILDYIEEGIHIIDKSGKIIYYNKFALKIDGIEREKVIGRHLLEAYPSLTHNTSTLLTVMETGESISRKEQTFLNYKGEKITTVNTSVPIRSNGEILGALEISKDITTVRELSETIVDLQTQLYNKGEKKKDKSHNEAAKYTLIDIIGENKEMVRLKSLALKAATTDASVLISGDTGTGKELFVHSIHNASKRRKGAFITQNCAALPSNLLEGILFGTIKGGFTGAEDRPGLFELASGGTLFLDEINSMPLELQSKLLRVLQDGNIRRVGATKTSKVDVRIIAATNIEAEVAVEKNQLRGDLYYRLNVISFQIPPLRERKDDIALLADYFIEKFNNLLGKNVKGLSDEVLEILKAYPWEGNVRELEHLIEGIISVSDIDLIRLKDLPYKFQIQNMEPKAGGVSLTELVENTERDLIKSALDKTGKNITKTAEHLQIPRQTLQYKIKKLGL